MRADAFTTTLKRLRYPLDKYFHERLRKANKINDLESLKKKLIHETAVKSFIRYQRADATAYNLDTIVFLAAEDVWIEFIKPRKKERHEFYEPELMEQYVGYFEPIGHLEAIDYLSILPGQHDPLVWKMLTLRAEGHTFEQISHILHIPKTTIRETIIKSQTKLREDRFPRPPDSQIEDPK